MRAIPEYYYLLRELHLLLRPAHYLEIGVQYGESLCLAEPETQTVILSSGIEGNEEAPFFKALRKEKNYIVPLPALVEEAPVKKVVEIKPWEKLNVLDDVLFRCYAGMQRDSGGLTCNELFHGFIYSGLYFKI